MSDLRRTMLWGIFLFSIFMLWDGWNRHNGQPTFFSPPTAQAPASAGPDGAASQSGGVPVASGGAAAAGTAATTTAAPAPAADLVTITTDLVKAQFDTRGGSMVRLELLKHRDDKDPTQPVVLFDRSAAHTYVAETGLIPPLAADAPLPNHTTVMTLQDGPRTLAEGTDTLSVAFESAEQGGVKLVKRYVFRRGTYAVEVQHEVANQGAAPVTPRLYLQLVRDAQQKSHDVFMAPTSFTGPAIYTEAGKFQKIEFEDVQAGKADYQKSADNGWIGMVQHYFTSAWLVNEPVAREFQVAKVGGANNLYAVSMLLPLPEVAPGASVTQKATLFAGPQEENKLAALAPGLELVKDYGMLTILAKPLFWLLDKLHGLLGNWGWSIVGLVVVLKIAFYWLNASAYRSMAKMKAINPRVTELRERHKDDPRRMQEEMMRIYREEKVNPLGGCLPIFVQMPFFIALYWVLLSSVEMRNAPWIGWITDLSAKDPFYVLPLLMTASTLLQTWLNPTPPDPTQAKMMWIMPLVFSVMFFVFPAGLVLYWLTNNLLSIAQQWMINRQLGVK